jgi:ketosteroid isomerase-like protein
MGEFQTVTERTALDVGTEFARAYAEGDHERVRELVAPDLLQREINPAGYVEMRGPDELIAEVRDFTGRYGEPEVLELTTEMAGPLVRAVNRWRLSRDGEPVLCDFYELLRIESGRVAQIDLVCSGVLPEAAAERG